VLSVLDFFEITMLLRGQAITHKPQPLHCSVSIVILPAIFSCFISVYDSSYRILTKFHAFVKRKRCWRLCITRNFQSFFFIHSVALLMTMEV
jgi:hypothetical protein